MIKQVREPPYPSNIHINIGGNKGDERISGDDLFIHDSATYREFYNTLETKVANDLNLIIDHQKYHNTSSANHFIRKISFKDDSNHIVMRIEWKQLLWSQKRLQLAKDIAESLCSAILHSPLPPLAPELKTKAIGYDGYNLSSPHQA